MKKIVAIVLSLMLLAIPLYGCSKTHGQSDGDSSSSPSTSASASASTFNTNNEIAVVSREDGSGTRGAFIELMGIEQKDADGNKVDMTTEEASITNSTAVMMTTVAQNPYAIGYISLGSLNDTVKALKVDGVEATVENIKAGTYKVARPFNIATKRDLSEAATDFISFIMSSDGQKIIEDNGYISVQAGTAYKSSGVEGKVVVAGSSSVNPVMEKLQEAYMALNDKVEITVQQSDSSTGMSSAISGICDIGMASRDLKDSELSEGLKATAIAMDGIAVIVNKSNTTSALTSEDIMNIFIGETLKWSELNA